jgi:hypothetical protein
MDRLDGGYAGEAVIVSLLRIISQFLFLKDFNPSGEDPEGFLVQVNVV